MYPELSVALAECFVRSNTKKRKVSNGGSVYLVMSSIAKDIYEKNYYYQAHFLRMLCAFPKNVY